MKNGLCASLYKPYHGEDYFFSKELSPTSCLDVVADGVSHRRGGEYKGDYASRKVIENLVRGEIMGPESISSIIHMTNKELSNIKNCPKSTVTATFKVEDWLHVFSAGDTPAYLIRNFEIYPLTVMDSSTSNPSTSIILNCVGIGDYFQCHHNEIPLEPGDMLLIGSDGLTDNSPPEEIAKIIGSHKIPKDAIPFLKAMLDTKEKYNMGYANIGEYDDEPTFKKDDATANIRFFPGKRVFKARPGYRVIGEQKRIVDL